MASGVEMIFEVEAVSPAGERTPLTVFIRTPAIEPAMPGCWTCVSGWRGAHATERRIYGATSLQALELSVPILQLSLDLTFPDGEILQDGKPFDQGRPVNTRKPFSSAMAIISVSPEVSP